MQKWKAYQQTYRTEPDLFDYARLGDLRGLANLLSSETELDIDATNQRGYSALMLSVYNGEKDFCEALLRCGANVNCVDAMGNSVLMGAAYKGNVDIFALLLTYGADITLNNKTNMNVRDWAQMFNRSDILRYLDDHYPNQVSSSKVRNIIRFMQLSFILLREKCRKVNQKAS